MHFSVYLFWSIQTRILYHYLFTSVSKSGAADNVIQLQHPESQEKSSFFVWFYKQHQLRSDILYILNSIYTI